MLVLRSNDRCHCVAARVMMIFSRCMVLNDLKRPRLIKPVCFQPFTSNTFAGCNDSRIDTQRIHNEFSSERKEKELCCPRVYVHRNQYKGIIYTRQLLTMS